MSASFNFKNIIIVSGVALTFLVVSFYFTPGSELAAAIFLIALAFGLLRFSIKVLCALLSMLLVSIAHAILYQNLTGLSFSFFQIIEAPNEAVQSIFFYLEDFAYFAIAEFILSTLIIAFVIVRMIFELEKRCKSILWLRYACWLLILAGCVKTIDLGVGLFSPQSLPEVRWAEVSQTPASGSVIMVQLESLNSNTVFPNGNPRPQFSAVNRLLENGAAIFPRFWGNSAGTHLGMLSILCGASGIIGNRLPLPPEESPCLPATLKKSDYTTSFYYSFYEPTFYDLESNVSRYGFTNFHYGEALMKKDDPAFEWGYEDCAFFERAYDHMESSGLLRQPKFFAHLSVHMNHMPFKRHLKIPALIENASSHEEEYLNSAYEQDYCLAKFLDRFENNARSDIHLFIVGDHSVPVKQEGGPKDRYMTSAFFLPAKAVQSSFKQGVIKDVEPAQDQIAATINELLTGRSTNRSFLWSIKNQPQPKDYETCHIIADSAARYAFAVEGPNLIENQIPYSKWYGYQYNLGGKFSKAELKSVLDFTNFPMSSPCLQRLGR